MAGDVSIDNVECLSLNTSQEGWLNVAVYFHGVVLIAGGQGEGDKILTTAYALKPPRINGTVEGEVKELGQWTKLSNELPRPVWPNCICRVDEEVFLFGEPACLS